MFENNIFNQTSRNSSYTKIPKVNSNKSTNYSSYNNILNNYIINKNDFNSNNNIPKQNNILIKNQFKNIDENRTYRSYSLTKKNFKNEKVYNLKDNYNRNNSDKYSKKILNQKIEYNTTKDIKNKSLYNLYNIKDNIKISKNHNENINSFNKQNSNSFNKIIPNSLTGKNIENHEKLLYNTIQNNNINNNNLKKNYNNENIIHKKNKSLNYNQMFYYISSSFLDINKNNISDKNISKNINNNINNNQEVKKEEKLYNYFNKTNANTIDKNEYYYTFRKGALSYYSFNSTNRKKESQQNNNMKPLIPIQNKVNYYGAKYNPNLIRTNSIYLNNYNKKICRIKKDKYFKNDNISFQENNINNKKGRSMSELTTRKDSNRQISNANYNTNNETKGGCSISSFSLYNTKLLKENQSFKNSSIFEMTNSISNSTNKNNNLYKHNILNKKHYKRKNKQNIRKYISSINDIGNIIQNKKGLNYCSPSNDKNKENKNINLEIDSNVVNECYINNEINNKNKNWIESSNGKNVNMTLQSINDSKILELAEHIINKGDDSLEQMDIKLIELKKNFKKEKDKKDITFG